MDQKHFENIYRRESTILNPRNLEFLDLNDRRRINQEQLLMSGSPEKEGQYYIPGKGVWQMAVIPALEIELGELNKRFEDHCQQKVNGGFQRPKTWPVELAEAKAKIETRKAVALEEIEFLKQAYEKAPVPKEEQQPIKHRRHWGSGSLRNGVLAELGGFTVAADKNGVLRISDPRSDHIGMETWRFRSQIFIPMSHEYGFRVKQQQKPAKAERRPYKEPAYPEAGVWNKETDEIEYPGYDQETLEKALKRSS